MDTSLITKKEIDRKHYLIDAENQILGRLAVKAAMLLGMAQSALIWAEIFSNPKILWV